MIARHDNHHRTDDLPRVNVIADDKLMMSIYGGLTTVDINNNFVCLFSLTRPVISVELTLLTGQLEPERNYFLIANSCWLADDASIIAS